MKTAMLGLHALVLLLVVGRLPDGQGAHAADDAETAAKASVRTFGETDEAGKVKKATAESAAEIRGLIPKAAAMAREEFEKLARSATAPRTSDLENKSLSFVLFTLRPKEHADAKEQFQFLKSAPKPSDIAKEVYRVGMRIGRFTLLHGPVTFIHADRITDFTCNVTGDMAKGTVSFKVPDLYQGKVDYVAKRKDGKWKIEQFMLPAYDIHIVRNAEGTWGKLSSEQRTDGAKTDINTIYVNVSAKKTIAIEGDETSIDDANAALSRLSSSAEERGKTAAAISVRITMDDRASYGDFRRAIKACQNNRFERFVLQCGTDSYPFSAPLAAPAEGLPDADMLPPLKVRLKARRAGELALMSLNDNNLGTNFEILHSHIISIIGDDRGPGSVAEAAELELHCDDALRFKYVAEAYRSVSYFVDESGTRVALIKKVWPLGSPRGVEIEELEEFEEALVEPMDIVPEVDPVEVKEEDGPDLSIDR